MSVGMPAWIALNEFGKVVRDAFDSVPYLVGSATAGKAWRDVDVRVILPDDEFEALLGPFDQIRPLILDAKWRSLCSAYAALGRHMTGLPIDFQIQQQTDANAKYDGIREALILTTVKAPTSRADDV